MAYGDYGQDYQNDDEYKRLIANYRSNYGSTATFDYNRYLNDSQYQGWVHGTRDSGDRQTEKQMALNQLLDYFAKPPFEKIDPKPYFDPLRGEIDKFAATGTQNAQARLNRLSKDAEGRLTEGLAGTGLGRSGVAQTAFSDIAEQRLGKMEDAAARIEERRQMSQLELLAKEAEFKIQETGAERNWTLEQINDAIRFQRSLWSAQFGSELQESEEDWEDTWGPIIGSVIGVGGSIYGGS